MIIIYVGTNKRFIFYFIPGFDCFENATTPEDLECFMFFGLRFMNKRARDVSKEIVRNIVGQSPTHEIILRGVPACILPREWRRV